MEKVYRSCLEAVADIPDGATVMFGGWGKAGAPENLILALLERGVKDLVAIANDPGNIRDGRSYGIALLIKEKRVRKFIGSYHAWNEEFMRQYASKEIEYEVVPQGTLAERIRAAGAGLGGFYTPAGAGTLLAEGKEKKTWGGREYILELPLSADFALLRANTGDRYGNLAYRYTAQNFNPAMATAARVTIAEVENLVGIGELSPNTIHTPGIYVDRVARGEKYAGVN